MSSWKLPQPMQVCYIVSDLDAVLLHWTRTTGAGPFFVIENMAFKEQWFRGQRTEINATMALGYWGDLQLEFVQQRNDAPSPYLEFTAAGLAGQHHLGVLTPNLDTDVAELEARGANRIYWGESATGLRFTYVASDRHPGGMIELIEEGPEVLGMFGAMREAARIWDGKDPIRRIG